MNEKERNATVAVVSLISIVTVIGIAFALLFVGCEESVSSPEPLPQKTLDPRSNPDATPRNHHLKSRSNKSIEQPPAQQYRQPRRSEEYVYDDDRNYQGPGTGDDVDGLGGPEWLDIPDPYGPSAQPGN